MKQLLKLSLALVVMVVFAAGAMAQSAERKSMSKDERMKMKMERMKSELSLTDDQVTKIQNIYSKHFNAENKSENKSKEDFAKKRAAIDQEVKTVLTADQIKKYEALKAERKAKMKEKHGNKGAKDKGSERRKNIQEKRQDNPTQ